MRLYIHIPFCKTKCDYCNFVSFASASSDTHSRYFSALMQELTYQLARLISPLRSVYIGGGTPTSVDVRYLTSLLAVIREHGIEKDAEFTVEANPASASATTFGTLRRTGVNRLSLGMQTSSAPLLKTLGRSHTFEDFLVAYQSACVAGFDNISVDIMYGIPGQSMAQVQADLDAVLGLFPAPQHISAYPVTHEPNTPFAKLTPVSNELCRQMYETVNSRLEKAGYEHYEISNWAKPGFEAQHNSGYWLREEYLGVGLGAHSFTHERRFCNTSQIDEYLQTLTNEPCGGGLNDASSAIIAPTEALEECIMLNLRLLKTGLNLTYLAAQYGETALLPYRTGILRMVKQGFLALTTGGVNGECEVVRLTPKGVFVSNYIIKEILCV